MKKLAIVINSIDGGGAEGAMVNLYKSFIEQKIETSLIAVNCSSNCKHDSNYICLGMKKDKNVKDILLACIELKKLIIDYEKVIVNCELPELIISLIPTGKSQLYVVEHTTKPWLKRKSLGVIVRLILKIRDVKWVKVNKDKNNIWPFSDKFTYIPNIVEISRTSNIVLNEELINLVYIGRLTKGKNPEVICRVARDLNLRLDIYGDGPLKKGLTEAFSNSSKIIFHGFIPKIWDFISQNSLVIVPSDYEGDGLVVVESLIRQNPILLSDNKDLRRFNLPDTFYFTDEKKLSLKISDAINSGIAQFRPNMSISNYYRGERSANNVSNKWMLLMEMN